MYILKTILMLPLLPGSMEGFRISDLRALMKEIVKRRIEIMKANDADSDEDDLDDVFLGFTEEQIQKSLQNVNKRKEYYKQHTVDKRIRTCSVNLSQSEFLIKDVYIANHCHNCKELKSNISFPINYAKNQDVDPDSSQVKLKKIVLKVFREQCFISVSIPENVTICTECKNRKIV